MFWLCLVLFCQLPLSNVCVPIKLAGLSLEQKLLPDHSFRQAPSTRRIYAVKASGCIRQRLQPAGEGKRTHRGWWQRQLQRRREGLRQSFGVTGGEE